MDTIFFQQQLLEHIGNKLYTIRHTKREKITVAAKEIGVSHPVISKIENGRYKGLSLDLLCRIATHYNVSVEHIIYGSSADGALDESQVITLLKEENKYLKEKLDLILNRG